MKSRLANKLKKTINFYLFYTFTQKSYPIFVLKNNYTICIPKYYKKYIKINKINYKFLLY